MRAMLRLSAPSRRDCSPDSALAARSRRGGFPSLHRCIAAVRRRGAMALLFVLSAVALLQPGRAGRGTGAASRTRFGRVVASFLLLAGLVVAMPAQAQTTTFVSNLGQTDANTNASVTQNTPRAQQFETGSNSGGYTLTEIVVNIRDAQTGSDSFALYTSTVDDEPGTKVVDLSGDSSTAGEQSFTPASATTLSASTKYIVAFLMSSGQANLQRTASNDIDSGASTGWDIADNSLFSTNSGASWSSSGNSVEITVKGSVVNNTNNAPEFANDTATRSFTETVGDATVTTAEDLGSPITATDTDMDTLTYTLGGSDAAKFDLDASSGQLATKVGEGYDREATASYSVMVVATDPDGASDSVAVTINLDNATELPLAPSDLKAISSTINRSDTDVTWTAPINTGRPVLLTYDVRYRTGTDEWTSQSVPANKTFVTLTDLMAETIYEFQVRALNLDGNGAWSDTLTYRTGVAATVPGAPTSFTATAGDGEVMLAWESVSETGGAFITEFQYRHAAGTTVPEITNWNTVPDSGDSGTDIYDERSFTVTSLTNGTEYAFELRAVNAVGGGTTVGPITATPMAPTPSLVSNIEQSVGSNSSAELGEANRDLHQAFTTGAVGAKLTSIKIRLGALVSDQPLPTMTLHSGSATSAAIATLRITGTASGFNVSYTYSAPANTNLAAATTYYVVVQGGSNSLYARATDSDNEDSGSEIGWSVADGYGWRGASSTGDFTIDPRALMILVDGTVASENNDATGTPTITAPDTDPATVGTTLTATAGDIADVDGLPSTFTYQWSRVDADGTSNEEAIAGATESTYVMAADDVGKKVTVALTFTDTLGSEETRTSAVYPSSGTIVAAAPACAAPNFGTRRNIWTGTVTVGTRAAFYGYSGATGDLDDKMFSIGSNNYQIDGVWVNIGSTSDGDLSFSLEDGDASLTTAEKAALRLHVCDTAYDFSAATLNSGPRSYSWADTLDWSSISSRTLYLSLPANTAATGTPTITAPDTDPTTVGSTLTATTGDIADLDGLPGTFTYQWSRVMRTARRMKKRLPVRRKARM